MDKSERVNLALSKRVREFSLVLSERVRGFIYHSLRKYRVAYCFLREGERERGWGGWFWFTWLST
jgi:predicted component of type VI protein secretion system